MRGLHTLALACLAASAAVSAAPAAPDLGTEQQREAGRKLYDNYCAQCHGVEGDGQGYATPRLKPEPRDFTSGKYKFRTTPIGQAAHRRRPAPSVIKDWPAVHLDARVGRKFSDTRISTNIIYYLKTMSLRTVAKPRKAYGEPIDIPSAAGDERRNRSNTAAQVYIEQGCGSCHGLSWVAATG